MFIVRFCNVVISEAKISSGYIVDIVKYECESVKKRLHERRTKKKLKDKMNRSNSFREWKAYAEEYDKFEGILFFPFSNQNQNLPFCLEFICPYKIDFYSPCYG